MRQMNDAEVIKSVSGKFKYLTNVVKMIMSTKEKHGKMFDFSNYKITNVN